MTVQSIPPEKSTATRDVPSVSPEGLVISTLSDERRQQKPLRLQTYMLSTR